MPHTCIRTTMTPSGSLYFSIAVRGVDRKADDTPRLLTIEPYRAEEKELQHS